MAAHAPNKLEQAKNLFRGKRDSVQGLRSAHVNVID
jgi:hypothetical protein